MEQFTSVFWPKARHLHSRCFLRCLIPCMWIIFLNFHYTHAINCYVCHSLNGSNPHCDHPNKIPVNNVNTAAPVTHNCRTVIGTNNSAADANAVACVTSVGLYSLADACDTKRYRTKYYIYSGYHNDSTVSLSENKTSGGIVMAVFRYCIAGFPPSGDPKISDTVCGESNTNDHLPGRNYVINGCRKGCTTDSCNSASTYDLVSTMRTEHKNYIEKTNPDPKTLSNLKFPDVFAVVEAQKLNEAKGSVLTSGTNTSPGSQRTQTAGYLVAAWTFLRIISLYLK